MMMMYAPPVHTGDKGFFLVPFGFCRGAPKKQISSWYWVFPRYGDSGTVHEAHFRKKWYIAAVYFTGKN